MHEALCLSRQHASEAWGNPSGKEEERVNINMEWRWGGMVTPGSFNMVSGQQACNVNYSERTHAVTTGPPNQRRHAHHNYCGMDVLSMSLWQAVHKPDPELVPNLC